MGDEGACGLRELKGGWNVLRPSRGPPVSTYDVLVFFFISPMRCDVPSVIGRGNEREHTPKGPRGETAISSIAITWSGYIIEDCLGDPGWLSLVMAYPGGGRIHG